MQIVQF